MQCNSCGAEVDSGLLFCPSCGALVKSSGTKPADSVTKSQPFQIEEKLGHQQLQPMAEGNTADSKAKSDVVQPAVVQSTQDLAPQPAANPEDEAKSSAGKSTFEVLPPSGDDSGKSGNKGLPAISPKVLIGVIAALAVVVVILFIVLLNSGNQDDHNATETTTSQPAVNQVQVEEYIYDEYGVFNDGEKSSLEGKARAIADEYGLGVYLLTTSNMGTSNPTPDERTSFAKNYYTDNHLGIGVDESGVLFVVAIDSRDYVTIAHGQGNELFDGGGIDLMEDAVVSHLSSNDWHGGAEAYLNSISSLLQGDESIVAGQSDNTSGNAATTHNEGNQQVGASEYDLSNQEDYKLINTFLSNFSEVYGHTAALDTSSMSAEDYARFAVYHCGINSHDDWQFAGGSGSYSNVQGTGGGAQGVYNVRIDGSRVTEMVNRYFGVSIDYGSISGGYRGPYHYQDGYVYFGVTAPASPAGVAVAKSIRHLGNGEYEIKFDVYTPSGGYYDASDASLYSASATEVAGKMGVSSPTASGTAVVRKAGSNEYTGGLVLESYQSKLL